MAAENKKLRDEIYQMKRANKQPGAAVVVSHDEVHVSELVSSVAPIIGTAIGISQYWLFV